MKTRIGFVSNSSSSSFVVIKNLIDEPDKNAIIEGDTLIVGRCGHREFGWNQEKFYDFNSKLNFAYLQLLIINDHINDLEYNIGIAAKIYWRKIYTKSINLLEGLLKDELKINNIQVLLNLDYHFDDNNDGYGYIDHQSTYYEDGACFEMFKNKNSLRNFLFNNKSYIATDNDNS